jgi:integrase
MAKDRIGTIQYDSGKGCYRVRLTLNDGARPWVNLTPTARSPKAEARAREVAAERSQLARKKGLRAEDFGMKPRTAPNQVDPTPPEETVTEYAQRWCEWREGRGLGCAKDDRTTLRRHVLPIVGSTPMRSVGRDDLKQLVMALDAKAAHGETVDEQGHRRPFGWKSACNAWTVVRALFRDAHSAKDVRLCIREDNPAEGVVGPDLGARKAKQYLWPSELERVVGCADVPLRWRRLFALAVYTYMRAGEIDALQWSDVDLDHGIIHIHRSRDARRGKGIKPTKSSVARRVPIEPALLPMLKAMHDESEGQGRVMRLPGDGGPRKLRMYLKRAGVNRADLFITDPTRKAMTFHDLRATGITWCAVRGDEPLKIMQRAGHADFATTQIYLREAENLTHGFGQVFPELPKNLVESSRESSQSGSILTKSMISFNKVRGPSGARTRTPLRAADFKSAAYADSAKGPRVWLSTVARMSGSLLSWSLRAPWR